MRTRVDDELVREARSLSLRFSCVHCAFFDPATRACAEGYPNEALAEVQVEQLQAESTLEFCKTFELA